MIRVDMESSPYPEWGYENEDGDLELVTYFSALAMVQITEGEGEAACIYAKDIPHLIKALQAAYDYSQTKAGGGNV